ncbi:Aste57867_12709 [Aphanomyces stellatus]|uniref:Aste57867_12709 protein n=1 Tax=Aphanomyces stellatus TaxID=120398 RepID=A0A485KWP6_9STRA|nr:hypothetical protein As57867_012661 [Aphanomyces stellatus]VFT89559.1 Aste57867_12709 [Aphanomyces stellatus]
MSTPPNAGLSRSRSYEDKSTTADRSAVPDRERGYYLPEDLKHAAARPAKDKKRKLEDGEVEAIANNAAFNGHMATPEDPEAKIIARLLGPFTRDQIVSILVSAALQHESIYNEIRTMASEDVAHRKLFVRGLSWDTTTATLEDFFGKFGKLEDCSVITDRNTGKSKGYGFVTFREMESADLVLQVQPLEIDGRKCPCNLAAMPDAGTPKPAKASHGSSASNSRASHAAPPPAPQHAPPQQAHAPHHQPQPYQQPPQPQQTLPPATPNMPTPHGAVVNTGNSQPYPDAGPPGDESERKLFVRGLDYNTHTETVTAEFQKFGELDEVSIAKDRQSGKSKGFAFIVFRHQNGAKRALAQPQKIIDGRATHCNLASQKSSGGSGGFRQPTPQPPMQPMPPHAGVVMPMAPPHPHHPYAQPPPQYMGYGAQMQYSPEMYHHMMPPPPHQYAPMPHQAYYAHPPPPSNPKPQ